MRIKATLVWFVALFSAAAIGFGYIFREADRPAVTVGAAPLPVIVIDAGHGGVDSGALGVDGTEEKDLNLSVARMLADNFRLAGYTVIETRTDDTLLGDGAKGQRKRADLEARLQAADETPDRVFISIHMNTYPSADCHGLQVWYSGNNAASKTYAEAVMAGVKQTLQPDNKREIKQATSSIYILKHAQNPAILIECGFLTNPTECARLCDENYQKQLALTIFSALHQKLQPNACA